jgi:predicted nucleotidyltransferase
MNSQVLRDQLQTILPSVPEVSLVYLFGSQVDGEVGPLSDYDLGVLVDAGVDVNHVLALLAHVIGKKLRTAKIDMVPLRRAPVELAFAIISQGVCVYQRDVVTRVEYEAQVMSKHGDYVPVLRAQREEILQGGGNDRRVQRYREALRRIERTLSQINTPKR